MIMRLSTGHFYIIRHRSRFHQLTALHIKYVYTHKYTVVCAHDFEKNSMIFFQDTSL